MEATHSLFDYRFSEDHPDVMPAINVRCGPELSCASNRFCGNLIEDRNATAKVRIEDDLTAHSV